MSLEILGVRQVGWGVFLGYERLHATTGGHGPVQRDVVRHPGGVAVLPVLSDGRVVFVEQFRVAVGRRLLEIPAGKLDPGEVDPVVAARRELSEEIGAVAERLEPLAILHSSPGFTDEVIHVYAGTGIVLGERSPDGAEEADARMVTLTTNDAFAMIRSGELTDAKSVAALGLWRERTT